MLESTDPNSVNPYAASGTVDDGVQFVEMREPAAADRISERTVEALAGSQGWVRLLGWLALLAGVGVGFRLFATAVRMVQLRTWALLPVSLNAVVAAMYLIGGILLLRYAGRVSDFSISRRVEHLDSALEALRSLWRFLGASIAGFFLLIVGTIALIAWGAGAVAIGNLF